MKLYVKSNISILGGIDVIAFVDDANQRKITNLPITASENYDGYSIDELMCLNDADLRSISTFYALERLNDAARTGESDYKLTNRQKVLLSQFYKSQLSKIVPSKKDAADVIRMLLECDSVIGPDFRISQPEKNFELVHGIELTRSDYLNIIHQLKPSECIGACKSYEPKHLGTMLYEFVHDPDNYKTLYTNVTLTSDIKIYIKLIPKYEGTTNIALISFHDAGL